MALKCAAGSIGSREREIISASRLLGPYPVPLSVVSDGKNAIVFETPSGKKMGEGLNAIPSKDEIRNVITGMTLKPIPADRLEKEKLIFRSYDSMNINRSSPSNR